MILTIVLTVYNKESYLKRAFDSLLSQIGVCDGDYEILAVNDGSTDKSFSILNEYEKHYTNVRVLTQENQGLSMARNNGLEAAQGEYVWFVDADDTVISESVRLICEAAYSHPDVIPIYAETNGINKIRNWVDENAKTGRDILLGGKWEQCGVFYVVKRSFLLENNLHFMPSIYHEDAEFTPRLLYTAQTIKVIPYILYTVFRDPESITQVPRPKRAFDYLKVAESLVKFVDLNGEADSGIGKIFYDQAALSINNGLYIIIQNSRNEQQRFNLAFSFMSKPLINCLVKSNQLKYKIEGLLFFLFKGKYVSIYKLLQIINK